MNTITLLIKENWQYKIEFFDLLTIKLFLVLFEAFFSFKNATEKSQEWVPFGITNLIFALVQH